MNPRNTARLIAAAFFLFWLSVFYAVADHPLPSGFIQIVLLVLVCAAIVYARLGAYIKWSHTRRKHRRLLALRDGLAAGLVIALLMLLLPGRSQPGVQPRPIDGVIWAAVLGTVGAVNALGVKSVPTCEPSQNG